MESLKNEEKALLKCLLCDASTLSKYELIEHIFRHLAYRKYQCSSCTELCYTEEGREKTSPWSRLSRGLQVKILQNLSRSDLDNCQLVNREMFGLIRCNEQLMKRRLIDYMSIRHQSLLYLNCSEKGVSKVIDLKTYSIIRETSDPSRSTDQSASERSWLHSLTSILYIVLKKADILHLEIDERLTDTVMVAISLCLSNAGCRVHMLTTTNLLADTVNQSMLLQFFRDIAPTGIRLLEPYSPQSLSPEVLLFIVTRQHFYLLSGDTIPIADCILAQLTATHFCIGAPNQISLDGLKSFAERLISGKHNVIRGIIYSDYSRDFEQCSLESMKNADLKLIIAPPYALIVPTEPLNTGKRSYLDDLTNSSFIPCNL